MKILAFSDLHGRVERLEPLGRRIREFEPHLLLFTGDIVLGKARGDEWLAARKEKRAPVRDLPEILAEAEQDLALYARFFAFLEDTGLPVMMVPGNMDAPEERFFSQILHSMVKNPSLKLVHGNLEIHGGFLISGYGGEVTEGEGEDYFVLRYPSSQIESVLRGLKFVSVEKILLFHSPPYGVLDRDGERHKGSPGMNRILELTSPLLAVVGHAHKEPGTAQVGRTLVVNPGALKDGHFAIIDAVSREVTIETL